MLTLFLSSSYALLGLLATLNPRQAGGIVPVEATPFALSQMTPHNVSDLLLSDSEEGESDEDEPEAIIPSVGIPIIKKLAKGEGRIERDPLTGKILRIVMGGEDGEEVSEKIVAREDREKVEGEMSSDEEDEDESDDEQDEKVVKSSLQTPWGEAMEVWDGEESDPEELQEDFGLVGPRSVGQGIPIGAKRAKVTGKTEVVRREYIVFLSRKI